MKGGTSLTSRLSFRAKLLLVLFVPFLALVVVAAAGLSDRFTALHAQEQYGDLSGPLRSLDDASRALQNESVVSSWYVAAAAAPPAAELDKARDAHRRRGRARSGPTSRPSPTPGLSPAALAALEATNRGFDDIPTRERQVDAAAPTPRARATSSSASTSTSSTSVSDVARDLASADVSASLTRVFALERAQHELRPRGERVHRGARQRTRRHDFSEWVGAQAAQAQHLATFTNTATVEELAAYTSGDGRAGPATRRSRRRSRPRTQTPAEYYVDYQRQTQQARPGDRRGRAT